MAGAGQIKAGRAYVEVGADDAPLAAALRRVQARLTAFGRQIGALGSGLSAAGGGVLAAMAWPLKLAADMETTRAAFTALLKDATLAGNVLADLQKFAASTPFEFPELADAGRKLLAFNIPASELISTLEAVGNVASAIDAPLGEIAEIYGKARVQGRLFMEDINQLTGRGIPIIQELAKQFGVTESKVRDLVSSGKVNFDNLEKAFRDMTTGAGVFANQMEAKSKTLWGVWSTLKDNIAQAIRPLGEAMLPAVKAIVSNLSTLAAVAGVFIEKHAQLAVYVTAAAAGVTVLGMALAALGFGIIGITASVQTLIAAGWALWGVFVAVGSAVGGWPILAAAAIGAMVGGVVLLGDAFRAAFGTIAAGWQTVTALVASGDVAAAGQVAGAALQLAWLQVITAMRSQWAGLTGAIGSGFNSTVGEMAKYAINAGANIAGAWDLITTRIYAGWANLSTFILNFLTRFNEMLGELGLGVEKMFSLDKDAVDKKFADLRRAADQTVEGRNQQTAADLARREEERKRRAEARATDAAAQFNAMDDITRDANAQRKAASDAAIKAAEERLKQATENFDRITAEAEAKARQKREIRREPELGQAAAAAARQAQNVTSTGTFNAFQVRSLLATTTADRTAKAAEATAAGVAQLVRATETGKLVFK